MPYCTECGAGVQSGDAFCTECGTPIGDAAEPPPERGPRPAADERGGGTSTSEDDGAGENQSGTDPADGIAAGSVAVEGPIESLVSAVTASTIDLLARGWNFLVANPASFAVFAVVAVLLVGAVVVGPPGSVLLGLLAGLATAVGTGVVVCGIEAADAGDDVALGALLARTADRLLAAIVAGVVWALLVTVGLVVLLLPGLYLMARFAFVAHVVYLEGAGPIDAFGASWARSDGHLLAILGVIVVLSIAAIVLNLVPLVGGAIVGLLVTPLGIAALTYLYLDLEAGEPAAGP